MTCGSAWSRGLPEQVAGLTQRWGLTLLDPFEPGGNCSWVTPGTDRSGRDVVLKVAWQHSEALHEAEGLAVMEGHGAIEVYAVERLAAPDAGASTALLLERCRPGRELRDRPDAEQHAIIVGLLQSVWAVDLPSDHPFRPLSAMADDWVAGARARLDANPGLLDPGVAREGLELFVDLSRPRPDDTLLFTDLHAGNVLARSAFW